MFEPKTQRRRWLVILLVVLSAHLVLGYVWFQREKPYVAQEPAHVDLAVNVAGAVPAQQTSEGERINESAQSISRTGVLQEREGLHAEAKSISLVATRDSNAAPSKPANGGTVVSESIAQAPSQTTNLEPAAKNDETHAVDCVATRKSTGAPAGMDVKVWVERAANGRAIFRGLVNQQSQASHYLTEVRRAVQDIQFVTQDLQCVGVKTMLTVRIVQ